MSVIPSVLHIRPCDPNPAPPFTSYSTAYGKICIPQNAALRPRNRLSLGACRVKQNGRIRLGESVPILQQLINIAHPATVRTDEPLRPRRIILTLLQLRPTQITNLLRHRL